VHKSSPPESAENRTWCESILGGDSFRLPLVDLPIASGENSNPPPFRPPGEARAHPLGGVVRRRRVRARHRRRPAPPSGSHRRHCLGRGFRVVEEPAPLPTDGTKIDKWRARGGAVLFRQQNLRGSEKNSNSEEAFLFTPLLSEHLRTHTPLAPF